MECWDDRANVGYRSHEEFIMPNGDCLGICTRCGEITDLKATRLMARTGNARCIAKLHDAGLDYLSDAEKTAETALRKLTPEQRQTMLRRLANEGG